MCKLKKKGLLAAALLLGASLGFPAMGAASVLKGDANVDGRNYPAVSPFVHPPFYNVRVKVETDDTGKIMKVEDNGTGLEGSIAAREMEEKWQAKNKPYWEAAIKAGLLTKFEGKTVVEVEAMQMNTGEADAISGATLVGLATQEAVLNALNGRQGKTFLPGTGSVLPVKEINGNDVVMESKLPADFVLRVLDIRYGIYNAEEDKLTENSYTVTARDGRVVISFKDISALKPGKYFVNIVDESGMYRSPNFESGHGEEDAAQAPRFIIESRASVSLDGMQIKLSEGELADYLKNVEHVLVISEGMEKAIEQEMVGHHGTVNAGFNLLTKEGQINPAATVYNRKDKTETPMFEQGRTYQITVAAFGYPELAFSYDAK